VSTGDTGYEDVSDAVFDIGSSGNQNVSQPEEPLIGDKNSSHPAEEKCITSNLTISGPRFSEPKVTLSPEMEQNIHPSSSEVTVTSNSLDSILYEKTETENIQMEALNDSHDRAVKKHLIGPQFSSSINGNPQSSSTESEKPRFVPTGGGSDNYYILKPQ
jgi:hypothetical protein